MLAGCGLNATRSILPVAEPDMTIMPRTKGIAANKDGISIVIVPLPDVKELDGFGVLIANETTHWVSFEKKDCVLIQGGEARQPMTKTQVSARLGGGYKASMPSNLSIDISGWQRNINLMRSRSRKLKIMDEDAKVSVMGNTKETVFLYFSTQGNEAPMQLIIPNMYNEATGQRTRFSFRFVVEKT
jgi:hypothetical protein